MSVHHCLSHLFQGITVLAVGVVTSSFIVAEANADNKIKVVTLKKAPKEPIVSGIIIKYKPQAKAFASAAKTDQMQRINSVSAGVQLKYFREMSGNAHVLQLPKRMSLSQAKDLSKKLMALPEVEYAEPDVLMFPMLVPSDDYYSQYQWNLQDGYGANVGAAWDITTGKNIVVAVIDTGITPHPDLDSNIIQGYDFISDFVRADDGDARDNNPKDEGDWTDGSNGCPASDWSSWHGTHVTGIIAAKGNNGGVAGVNWAAKILPVRVMGKCGGTISDIADGMIWAAGLSVPGAPKNNNPARVLNISLAGKVACGQTFQDAVTAINKTPTIIVVSAGNNAEDASLYAPANCNGVITVGASERNGLLATYSNRGAALEISAPGGLFETEEQAYVNGILSTLNDGQYDYGNPGYAFYQGTSMAAPHISGIISLMLSLNPNLRYADVLKILQGTARDFNPNSVCSPGVCGAGIVDAAASLQAVPRLKTLTFYSNGTADGRILESSENSSLGGIANSGGTQLHVGDFTGDRQFRTLLSFNTGAIPDNAVITKATLKLKQASVTGTTPFDTHGSLLVDIRKATFGNPGLQVTDFEAPGVLNVGTIAKPVNSLTSNNILKNGLPYVNRKGTTEFRLRFTKGDNDDMSSDYASFFSGNVTTVSSRPTLVVQYYLPPQ